MNPVHAVLRNWDILQTIMNFVKEDFSRDLGRRDLVAVALVCRALCDLALNVLWRHVDMEKIHLLFPMDIIDVYPSGIKSLASITPKEWERFDFYASRIRELSATPSPDDQFLRGVRMRPTLHHPFPNLTRLWWMSTSSGSVDVTILICPTLTEVSLVINDLQDDEDTKDTLADVLQNLGEKCSQLKKFRYAHLSTPSNRSNAIETSLIHLIRQCRNLEDVHLPVSRDLLRSLASLPHLSTLVLGRVNWEDRSQLDLPIQAEELIEQVDKFPVLDDLTIQESHTVSSLTECFQGSGCFPRKSFTMWDMSESEQWSGLTIAEFFRGIMRPDRSEGLRVFQIDIDRPTDNVNPVEHDPWPALQCLSSIPTLQTLTLDGLFLDIRDTDLVEIARMWPALQSLSLAVPCCENYQAQISFQGFAHLSTLENLESLCLMLAPESTISKSMLSPSTLSNSRLKYLNIQGTFPPVPAYEAALFLILYFPALERIDTLLSNERERARINEIQVVLDVARPVMKRLRSGAD